MNYNIKTVNIEDQEYPECLRAIHKPPRKLYAIGDVSLLKANCVAVVGSRHCSNYGYRMAVKFAKELSEKRVTVISGLAVRNRRGSTCSIYEGRRQNHCSTGLGI